MSGEPRYNQPAQGTTNWHVPLNENFGQLGLDMDAVEEAISVLDQNKANASEVTTALAGKSDTTHTHTDGTLDPAALSGTLVNRAAPIDSLPGNIYYVPEGAADPTQNDGDIVFYYSEA